MTRFGLPLLASILLLSLTANVQADESSASRGEYLLKLSGCASCHTREGGQPLAGGLKMETPFGTFYTPNITPDPKTGIGNWSDDDFIRALTEGVAPDGSHYYPAFPYTSYSRMSRQDLRDLKAYLNEVPAVQVAAPDHDLKFPFNLRVLLGPWKWVNFEPDRLQTVPQKSAAWNRGRYIVQGPGHCVECHTPRNRLGGLEREQALMGNPQGPDGEVVPPIVPTKKPFSEWGQEDIVFALQTGMKPDGDFLGGTMGHVIENSTGALTESDLKAIAEYLLDPREPL
ncbi:c-type cytochrome [Sedimenticola sp.]|uniref:cytochrome c n=1 Tax=Sedimenticola sp. TaxID=1940285 RepID=UPI003D14C9C5